MKRKLIGFLFGAMCIFSCNTQNTQPQNHVTVINQPQSQQQDITVQAAPNLPAGFNINNFASLLQNNSNPDALTQTLNTQPNNINHLDLDGDGDFDYLRVNQVDNNTLVVMDEINQTQKISICTLSVNTSNNSYQINGTPEYCGNNSIYNSQQGLTFTQIAFLSWWISPYHYSHPYYCHWGYHNYYRGYHPYHPKNGSGLYTTKEVTTYKTYKSAPKTAASTSLPKPAAVPNVSAPTKSEKQFKANEGDRYRANNTTTNAFTPKQTTVIKPSPVVKPSAKSFGSSKSSFGKKKK